MDYADALIGKNIEAITVYQQMYTAEVIIEIKVLAKPKLIRLCKDSVTKMNIIL